MKDGMEGAVGACCFPRTAAAFLAYSCSGAAATADGKQLSWQNRPKGHLLFAEVIVIRLYGHPGRECGI